MNVHMKVEVEDAGVVGWDYQLHKLPNYCAQSQTYHRMTKYGYVYHMKWIQFFYYNSLQGMFTVNWGNNTNNG